MRAVILGAKGQLGRELELALRGSPTTQVIALDSNQLDITDRSLVKAALTELSPDVVFNAAAFTKVDACEEEDARAYRVNALGVRNLVQASSGRGFQIVHFSTDYVFDGTASTPYKEWDQPNPLSIYGKSKLAGELELRPEDLCIRTSWLVGRYGANIVKTIMDLESKEETVRFVNDQFGSLTVAQDLAVKVVEMVQYRLSGLYHVSGQGVASWFKIAQTVFEQLGSNVERVQPIPTSELPKDRKAPRPAYSVMDNFALRESGVGLLPRWDSALSSLISNLLGTKTP